MRFVNRNWIKISEWTDWNFKVSQTCIRSNNSTTNDCNYVSLNFSENDFFPTVFIKTNCFSATFRNKKLYGNRKFENFQFSMIFSKTVSF